MRLAKESQNHKCFFREDNRLSLIKMFIRVCLTFFSLLWLVERDGFCGNRSFQGEVSTSPGAVIRSVALLPLENLSMSDSPPPDIITLIGKNLVDKRKVKVLSSRAVEEFLVKKRIRDTGSMGKAIARQMGKTLKVDGIIITYIDLLALEEDPRIGIGCRMVSGHDGSLIWTGYEALAGSDFVSWLGLGKIDSLEILAKMAVEKLILAFPQKVKIIDNNIAPFEITEISVNPRSVRSSERIKIQLKLAYMGKNPYRIKAILGDQERSFFDEGKKVYSCILYAPLHERKYPLRIEARDQENNFSVFNFAAIIDVDNTPPKVVIYYQDELFSPNRDKIKDKMIFFPYLEQSDTVNNWQLIIEDSEGELVRKAEGRAELPRSLVWRGENDLNSIMGDGKYYFRIRVEDKAGNVAETAPKLLILDKTPPDTQIILELRENEGFRFNFDCKDENGIAQWQLTIQDSDRKIIKSFEGEGELPASLEWKTDISSDLADINYSFEVKDIAGNFMKIGPRSFKGEFISRETSASEQEEKNKEWNYDF